MKNKILIVEDEPSLNQMYKLKFEKEGFITETADNWFNALMKIQNFTPDIILLDIMMPDIDGFKTLNIIRQQTSLDTKIIIFSNLNKKEDIDKAFDLWADEYLIKADITPKQAVEKVREMLSVGESEEDTKPEQTPEKPEVPEIIENKDGAYASCPNCNHEFYFEPPKKENL